MTKPLENHLDADDRRIMAWSFCAASTLVTALALHFDWVLAAGILSFLRTNQNLAAYALGVDLLPWAAAFTLAVSLCAALGVWLATRPADAAIETVVSPAWPPLATDVANAAPTRPLFLRPSRARHSRTAHTPACAA